jgi:hypothetical protein
MGQLSVDIMDNGVYTAIPLVNCDPKICGDCYAELTIPLEQEFCDNTFLKVTVTDLETSAPVKDASVQISMKTGNTS